MGMVTHKELCQVVRVIVIENVRHENILRVIVIQNVRHENILRAIVIQNVRHVNILYCKRFFCVRFKIPTELIKKKIAL